MTARNDALTEDIRRLREDPSAVEELAREELGLMKDGELLIILRDTPPVGSPAVQRSDLVTLTVHGGRGTIHELFGERMSLRCNVTRGGAAW